MAADAHIKESTKKYYEQIFNGFAAIMAESGRNGCATSFRARLQGLGGENLSGVQRNSRHNTLMVLRNILKIAVEAGSLYSNPARALGRAKLHPKDLLLPSREQFIQFEKAIRGGGGRYSRDCADFVQFIA